MCVLYSVFCPCRYKVSTIPDNFISYKNIIACDIFCPPTLKFQVEKCSFKEYKRRKYPYRLLVFAFIQEVKFVFS